MYCFWREAVQMKDEPARSRGAQISFHIMVRESGNNVNNENNVEHLRLRGASSGNFLSHHSSFGSVNRLIKLAY